MGVSRSRGGIGGLVVLVGITGFGAHARVPQQATVPPAGPVTDAPGADAFPGLWQYNERESVNAATGRPERTPQTAAQRGAATVGRPSGAGRTGGYAGGRGGRGAALSALAMMELRGLVRDLIEVPESLTISVTAEAVTFIDDLGRERTYPTDNRKQKYQLGAAIFDARVRWDGQQLKKDIEGPRGFKLFETYFLSADARRLFVIIRVGEQRKNAPVVGVNRVYDRVAADR